MIHEVFLSDLLDKIDLVSTEIRQIEDQSRKFGLDFKTNPIHIALKAYKLALEEVLRDYRK